MSMVVVGVVGAVGNVVGGIFGRKAAKKAAREAAKRRAKLQAKMAQLEASRQEIINPYEGVKDLTSMISNPFAQLSVATKAAEIQIEEADISLANTLDTMRATGASAGGATALANAALAIKQSSWSTWSCTASCFASKLRCNSCNTRYDRWYNKLYIFSS